MAETRRDGFLDGRLQVIQPARGYRAGADAVMLAAACPAQQGQSVLELGCGVGVASLCLGWRIRDLSLIGLERQSDYAAFARDNAHANGMAMDVVTGDLAQMPASLRAARFDHVIMNPPYFLHGTVAPDAGRDAARREVTPLPLWIAAGLRRLVPGGWLTLIQRADRLDAVIAALAGHAGGIVILPVAARTDQAAGRVLVAARKGARSPLRLLAPLLMHEAGGVSPAAARILRDGAPINLGIAKVP